MKTEHSSAQVAKAIGVSKRTLLEWLYVGKLDEPKSKTFGGVKSRVWSDGDVERARRYKEEHYRKRS